MWNLGFVKKGGKTRVTTENNYIETYGKLVKDVFAVGGFPLVLAATSGVLVLAVLLSNAIDALVDAFPWLIAFSSLFLVSAVVLYVYETSWKRKMLEHTLERFDRLSTMVLEKYLASKTQVDLETVTIALKLINSVTDADRKNIADKPNQLDGAQAE